MLLTVSVSRPATLKFMLDFNFRGLPWGSEGRLLPFQSVTTEIFARLQKLQHGPARHGLVEPVAGAQDRVRARRGGGEQRQRLPGRRLPGQGLRAARPPRRHQRRARSLKLLCDFIQWSAFSSALERLISRYVSLSSCKLYTTALRLQDMSRVQTTAMCLKDTYCACHQVPNANKVIE